MWAPRERHTWFQPYQNPTDFARVSQAAARGVKTIAVISSDVQECSEAVDLLKNIGAEVALPANMVIGTTFREICADLGPASLLVVDVSTMDCAAVNAVLAAPKAGFSKARALLESSDERDVRDAKVIAAVSQATAKGCKVLAIGGRAGDEVLAGTTPFDVGDWLAQADAAALADALAQVGAALTTGDLKVWAETHNTAMLARAQKPHVFQHAFRTGLWLQNEQEVHA